MNDVARQDALPNTLGYYSSSGKSAAGSVLSSIITATFCFAAAHFVAECLTGYLGTFEFHWLGPASNPRQLEKLTDHYLSNIVIEVLWLIPAAALVFLTQLGLGLYRRDTLRPPRPRIWTVGVSLGVCYCWARWGLWGLSKSAGLPFAESTNFFSSMFFAVLIGVVLAICRRA
jgi:hypothetical protein